MSKRNKNTIKLEVLKEAFLLLKEGLTLKEISEMQGVSITTVYNDLTIRLPELEPEMAIRVKEKLEENRHRGSINKVKKEK